MLYERFDSVFDALADTHAESVTMKARFELLSALQVKVNSWDMSQNKAAARLDITRPRLNALVRGKLAKFSLDALVNLTALAGSVLEKKIEAGIGSKGKLLK